MRFIYAAAFYYASMQDAGFTNFVGSYFELGPYATSAATNLLRQRGAGQPTQQKQRWWTLHLFLSPTCTAAEPHTTMSPAATTKVVVVKIMMIFVSKQTSRSEPKRRRITTRVMIKELQRKIWKQTNKLFSNIVGDDFMKKEGTKWKNSQKWYRLLIVQKRNFTWDINLVY